LYDLSLVKDGCMTWAW